MTNGRRLLNARHPLWKAGGWALVLGIAGFTGVFMTRGPRPLKPAAGAYPGDGTQGRFGTFVEQLGNGRFVLSYETIEGTRDEVRLGKVAGRLEEPETIWGMVSPSAARESGVWTLMGPMQVEAHDPKGALTGKGFMSVAAPALAWDQGVWKGLAPLVWDDLEGNGRGRWFLPAGWRRGLDGRFKVAQGPVRWEAAEPGTLHTLTAGSMEAVLGFREGTLGDVEAHLEGGDVQARRVDITVPRVVFQDPVTFQRADGWKGSAQGGEAPRPPKGEPFEQLEFRHFQASRAMGTGTESVQALGARWTQAGLRLEGDVRLEQPAEGQKALLRAPRVLQRTAPGPDLPAALGVGETWAEPQAVLSWGERTLSSPRMIGRHKDKAWRIQAPVLGRGEMGTFTAGEGEGTPRRWTFKGPILARFFDGAIVRGDFLLWEDGAMTLTGRPVTWTRLRQRLAGAKVRRAGDTVQFPEGISGALAGQGGDINLRAERADARGALLNLDGRVECTGEGWRLQADHISVTLGPGNTVKQISANGTVVLKGRLGEGRGDALDLDPAKQTASWHGNVRAITEVRP
ncbi:MAG TPA: hypothetical protein VK188_16100 [Holophaga sp.]|nr:hypothetical protein [Holophaga sp.]